MTIFVTLIDRMGRFVDDIVDYANKSFNLQMVIDGDYLVFSHTKITVSGACYHHQCWILQHTDTITNACISTPSNSSTTVFRLEHHSFIWHHHQYLPKASKGA